MVGKLGILGANGTVLSEEKEGMTFFEAVSNQVISMIGAMLLFFAGTMATTGYIMSPLTLLLCALVIIEMSYLICASCDAVEEKLGGAPGSVTSYEELAKSVGLEKLLFVTKNSVPRQHHTYVLYIINYHYVIILYIYIAT